MDIDKADIEWLIMLIVTLWPSIKKLFKKAKEKPSKRQRGKRKR